VGVSLLDELAPRSAEALWQIAGAGGAHEAIHAMWTGPEISCPIPAANLPVRIDPADLPLENATSYPEQGDIAVIYVAANTWKGQPSHAFFDVGVFYGTGARLLMPMGWIQPRSAVTWSARISLLSPPPAGPSAAVELHLEFLAGPLSDDVCHP